MLKVLKVLKALKVPKVRVPLAVAVLAVIAAGLWLRCRPVPEDLLRGVDAPSTVIVDRHGRVLYEALTAHGARVTPIGPAAIPPILEAATLGQLRELSWTCQFVGACDNDPGFVTSGTPPVQSAFAGART